MAGTTHNGNGNGNERHDLRHVTETPDVSHIKNLDVTHEASDVSVSGVVKFVLALSVLGVVVFVLMWGMFRFLSAQETEKEPHAGPMAMTEQERLPPEPRLQAAKGFGVKLQNGEWVTLENREPEAEYRVLREQWDRRLNCSGEAGSPEESTSTRRSGAVQRLERLDCIPINVAIDNLLEGGSLRVRESVNNSQKPADVALPTAASSGRMTEKGNSK